MKENVSGCFFLNTVYNTDVYRRTPCDCVFQAERVRRAVKKYRLCASCCH